MTASRQTHPDPIVVVKARRSPIGSFLGSLRDHSVVDLGKTVVTALLDDLPKEVAIDRVLLGCARQAGAGPNPARQVAVRSGLGNHTVAQTINMACASGMESIVHAARMITLGETDWVVAGGMESMSRVPFLAERFRTGYRMGHAELVDGMYRDGFFCPVAQQIMGETAETLARQYEIDREQQDIFALESQNRALAAIAAGRFDDEIVPIPHTESNARKKVKGSPYALAVDEHPRPGSTLEKLNRLRPAFDKAGSVTAGNSSGITDGAAALLLTRASRAKRAGLPILGSIRGHEVVGIDPKIMGISPVSAVQKLLGRLELELDQIDLIELNEAFAAQLLAVDRELHFQRDRLNVNGGAIALGHPIGCTGARIVVTLLHEMKRRDVRLGLATLCVSGGLGMAILFDRQIAS